MSSEQVSNRFQAEYKAVSNYVYKATRALKSSTILKWFTFSGPSILCAVRQLCVSVCNINGTHFETIHTYNTIIFTMYTWVWVPAMQKNPAQYHFLRNCIQHMIHLQYLQFRVGASQNPDSHQVGYRAFRKGYKYE